MKQRYSDTRQYWRAVWRAAAGLVVGLALSGAAAVLAGCGVTQASDPSLPPTTPPGSAFDLRGLIQQITPGEWVVADMPVTVDGSTTITGVPSTGAEAQVRGELRADGTILARAITVLSPPPTAEPTSAPTAPPTSAPTSVPLATAAPVPAPPISPFAMLRALIEAGIADGRVESKEGAKLLDRLAEAESSLAEGDTKRLRDRLRDVQNKTRELVREGRMDAGFGQQVLDSLDTIAANAALSGDDRGDDDD
jgi:hypothetical protein